ncbi:XrtA/PEP-CTERM system histidine kinase PrsK [Pseudomaricurvus sp.]|uniref:XrtA/PEP-CTERM system histidine kinase PrsK n=1 Tax=Pseudomaricurvus sp. TaxID=2004510 RepID=UPI003F6C34B6
MISNPGFYSYLLTFLAFSFLSLLLIASSRKKEHGKRLILACIASSAWALLAALQEVTGHIPQPVSDSLEWLRYATWAYFLAGLILNDTSEHTATADDKIHASGLLQSRTLFWMGTATYLAVISPYLLQLLPPTFTPDLILTGQAKTLHTSTLILLTILGLGVIEQIIRSSSPEQRWVIKFLCLGIGAMFAYDFYMYSEALLFKEINPQLWAARGVINALTVPLIAVSAARHTNLNLGIHVSRHVVFQSATVMGAGIYLLAMSAMGYYVRYIGGTWGNLLQILFLFGSGLLLAVMLFSNKLRMTLKVLLNKHFYSYKYDYRQQWLDFTHQLANTSGEVPDRSCQAIGGLLNCSGALLWSKNLNQKYQLMSHWNMPAPDIGSDQLQTDLDSINRFLEKTLWVIDFDEFLREPERYESLNIPEWLIGIPKVWLIVPLILQNQVLGFVLLKKSDISTPVNWEDRDLLKMAGQQAAIHLAQYRSEMALIEARQFEAYNRLSTYVMHDLKNILAQQSLIVSNAEKHRHKQAFVDDVLSTVANSVDRMERLLGQMKRGERNDSSRPVELRSLMEEVSKEHAIRKPVPQLQETSEPGVALADREQLKNVLGHLVQNAQEATPDDGQIHLTLSTTDQSLLITVSDTGQGMDPDFIRDRLFKPFDSTKGLMGMGIGAYESRQYILSIGGDIRAYSEVGKGSEFKITLPALQNEHGDSTPKTPMQIGQSHTASLPDISEESDAEGFTTQRSNL